jgi:hypothetical protein
MQTKLNHTRREMKKARKEDRRLLNSYSLAAVFMLALVSACGGSENTNNVVDRPEVADPPDYNSNFIGTWQGNVTTTIADQSSTSPVRQPIAAISKNRFRFEDSTCPLDWTATSTTSAMSDVGPVCSNTSDGCTLTISVTSGSFVRESDGARASVAGEVTAGHGCSVPAGTALAFTQNSDLMTRVQGALVAQGESLDSTIAPSGAELSSLLRATLQSFSVDR